MCHRRGIRDMLINSNTYKTVRLEAEYTIAPLLNILLIKSPKIVLKFLIACEG